MCVRAGDVEALAEKNLRETAHADAADADEVKMKRLLEIYLIHIFTILVHVRFYKVSYAVSRHSLYLIITQTARVY